MPEIDMPLKFDVNDVAAQIDVLREYLRNWYAMHGPIPPKLAEDHDMGYAASEAARLKNEADAADLRAKALRDFESTKDAKPAIKSAADQAEEDAKLLRAQAEEAATKASASSVSMQKWGEGYKGSNRDPNAPRAEKTADSGVAAGNASSTKPANTN